MSLKYEPSSEPRVYCSILEVDLGVLLDPEAGLGLERGPVFVQQVRHLVRCRVYGLSGRARLGMTLEPLFYIGRNKV